MNCQNAQSMVLNFINNKLDKEETKAFIEHVRDCKDCWEELEIYYVLTKSSIRNALRVHYLK